MRTPLIQIGIEGGRKLRLAPEALSHAFSALRQSGVTVKGRTIEIHDRHVLERF